MTSQSKNREHGVALLFCLFALLILTGVTASLIMLAGTETSVNYNYRTEETAFFAAKAGLYEALDRMQASNASPLTLPTAAPSATGGVLYLLNPGSSLTVQPWSTTNTYVDDEFCHEGYTIAGMTSKPPDVPCTTVPTGTTWYTTATSNYPWSGTSTAIPYEWVRINWKVNSSQSYLSGGTTPVVSTYSVNSTGLASTGVCWNGASEVLVSPVVTSTTGCHAMQNSSPATLDTPVYLITALAVTPNGSRQMVQAEVALPPPPILIVGFFANGTACNSNLSADALYISGSTTIVDGFNSAAGTYAATKSNSLGSVGSNGGIGIAGGASVGGSVNVTGTALTGGCPAQDVWTSGGSTYGTMALAPTYTPPIPAIPANTSTTDNNLSASTTLPPGNYRNITAGGGKNLTLTAPGTYNIKCLTVGGGSQLIISPPTSQVIINITGDSSCTASSPINLNGGVVTNTSGIAANLTINYAGTAQMTLSGGSNAYLVVNAPNAPAVLSGGSDFYGAMIAKTINDGGGTKLHFDTALNATSTASSSYQTLAFRSLPY